MASPYNKELKKTFGPEAIHWKAVKTLNGPEWKEYRKIKEDHATQRRFEQRAYELEYKTRFELTRKRLINEAGKKKKDFKHLCFGKDPFDRSAIERQAHRTVRHAHSRLLAHMEKLETKDVEALLDRSAHRQKLREKPRQDFTRAANRRSGVERRKRSGPTR